MNILYEIVCKNVHTFMKKNIWTPRVFNFFTFFERILYKSNYIIFIFSWCGTHTKIRSKLVVIVTAGSQKITLWGPQRTPLGILRVKDRFHLWATVLCVYYVQDVLSSFALYVKYRFIVFDIVFTAAMFTVSSDYAIIGAYVNSVTPICM